MAYAPFNWNLVGVLPHWEYCHIVEVLQISGYSPITGNSQYFPDIGVFLVFKLYSPILGKTLISGFRSYKGMP